MKRFYKTDGGEASNKRNRPNEFFNPMYSNNQFYPPPAPHNFLYPQNGVLLESHVVYPQNPYPKRSRGIDFGSKNESTNDGGSNEDVNGRRNDLRTAVSPLMDFPSDGLCVTKGSAADTYPHVTEAMQSYVRTNGQSKELLETKFRLRAQFEKALKNLFPNCDLFMFGSSASGFGSQSSDMDMCLVTNNNIEIKEVKLLFRIKSMFMRQFNLSDVQVINAKVAIMKFIDSRSKIHCDLNINNSDGVRNTHLLKYYTIADPRLVPLVLTIKRWARHHKINDASQGTLSSYALTLMTIHYLQCGVKPAILPNLIAENPEVFHPRRPLQSLSFYDKISGNFRSDNIQSVGELFVGFLTYYSEQFNYEYTGISLREARAIPKRTSKEFSKWLFIEEPYNLDNVGRAVQKRNEVYIKKVIDASKAIITHSKDLESAMSFDVQGRDTIGDHLPWNRKNQVPAETGNKPNATTSNEAEVKGETSSSTTASSTTPSTSSVTTTYTEKPTANSTAMAMKEDFESVRDPNKSEIVELYELASKRTFNVTFDLIEESGPSHMRKFVTRCNVISRKGGVETLLVAEGEGSNKRLSKNSAAGQMLEVLKKKSLSVSKIESFP